MVAVNIHTYSSFFHRLSLLKHRSEQGFYSLSTYIRAGYYDYLYIHRSRCETNLSLNWGTP